MSVTSVLRRRAQSGAICRGSFTVHPVTPTPVSVGPVGKRRVGEQAADVWVGVVVPAEDGLGQAR